MNEENMQDQHSIIFASGIGIKHTDKRKTLNIITWPEVQTLIDNPQCIKKNCAQWIMASSLTTRDGSKQKADGEFHCFILDIDTNPPQLEDLCDIVEKVIGEETCCECFTTKSATEKNQKSRVLIPLFEQLTYEDWHKHQVALNDRMEEHGITPDRSTEKPAQIQFLPNRGDYYKSRSVREGKFIDISLLLRSDTASHTQPVVSPKHNEETKIHNKLHPVQANDSLIQAFNDQNKIEEILLRHGYDQEGDKFRHPASQSGSFSASVQKERVHSLSTSDPLYTDGGGVGAHDAFSAFAVLKHDSDKKKALKDAGDNWVTIGDESWNAVKQHEHKEKACYYASFELALAAVTGNDSDQAFDEAILYIAGSKPIERMKMIKRLSLLSELPIGEVKKLVVKAEKAATSMDSHQEIAQYFIEKSSTRRLVGYGEKLWHCDEKLKVWTPTNLDKIGVSIARFIGPIPLCKKKSEYQQLARHAYDISLDEDFFNLATPGLLTPSGLITIEDGELNTVKATAEHRARFRLEYDPDRATKPKLFLSVLNQAFSEDTAAQQIRQLRMFVGLALFNLQIQTQRCVLLYGVAASGKSLFLKVLEAFFPNNRIATVSPMDMNNDYKKASLLNAMVNIVPEISKDIPLPSADFKAIAGGDRISARQPYEKTFTFSPTCAHWFNGNFYPTTTDFSEGHWRRWAIVHFTNAKPESERDPMLLKKIIDSELPQILGWALEGVKDYFSNEVYLSDAHHACIREWKHDSDNVAGWIQEAIASNALSARSRGDGSEPCRITEAYSLYAEWCSTNGRRQYGNPRFKSHMKNLSYLPSKYNGYDVFSTLTKVSN